MKIELRDHAKNLRIDPRDSRWRGSVRKTKARRQSLTPGLVSFTHLVVDRRRRMRPSVDYHDPPNLAAVGEDSVSGA